MILFRDIQEKIYRHYAKTATSPDEVLVGSNVNYAGVHPSKMGFENGRVVFFSEATHKPFSIVVDRSLQPNEIVCRSEPGEKR